MDNNDQQIKDRLDSSSELNRTWYFESFFPSIEENISSSGAFLNKSKFFASLERNLNDRMMINLNLNSDRSKTKEFSSKFESKLISSTYEELKNNNSQNNIFFNSTIDLPFNNASNSSSLDDIVNSTKNNLQMQLNDEDKYDEDKSILNSQLFNSNFSSIQNLINDQMYFVLNDSSIDTFLDVDSTSIYNSTTFNDEQPFNVSMTTFNQPHYNWIYIFVVFLIIFGVFGNCLVCLAICIEKRLQNATNYFLLSLAICDLLVSLIVMPFLMLFDFYGYWPFGTTLCNFWVTCDVLLCTSSIIHLLFISVTRYIGIRHPLTARRVPLLASRKAAMLKILIVWLLAAIISSPITILGSIDTINIEPEKGVCAINNRLFFTIGSIVSFFLPMLIMVNTYVLTIRLLKRKAKLCQKESATLQHQSNGSKSCVQCKVLVKDSSNYKRNSSISSSSETNYSAGLGSTAIKNSNFISLDTQPKITDSCLPTSTSAAREDQLIKHKNQINKTNSFNRYDFSLFERFKRNSKTSLNDEKSTEFSKIKENKFNFEKIDDKNDRKTLKNKIKLSKKQQRTKDLEKFQGIRVLFSKRKKTNKTKCKKNGLNMKKNIKIEEKSEKKNNENQNLKTNSRINKTDYDFKQIKNIPKQSNSDLYKIRKSNTFTNLDNVREIEQQKNFEINNNQSDQEKRRKNSLKTHNQTLALLSPCTIAHQTRRLSAHAEIQGKGQANAPITPTSSSNPNSSIQPVLVRTLGSSQVLTEQKATKVLGIVFFVFISCWSPFFLHNFLAGVSPDLVSGVPSSVVSFLQWLGYVSSLLNPVIYTVFNVHFRRTFRKIILCQHIRISRHKSKCNSPRLTNASRMTSFRGLSISRGQTSSINRKKPPAACCSTPNKSITDSSLNNEKRFNCRTVTASHKDYDQQQPISSSQIDELNCVRIESNDQDGGAEYTREIMKNLNNLEKPGQKI